MGFGEAIRSVLSKYASFSGRARRAEYWWFVLFNLLVSMAASVLDLALFRNHGMDFRQTGPLEVLTSLALLLPSLAVWFRRLHDVGRSGWWWLLGLIPIVGWIVLFYWSVRRGDTGTNAYGPDPISASGNYGPSDIPRVTRR